MPESGNVHVLRPQSAGLTFAAVTGTSVVGPKMGDGDGDGGGDDMTAWRETVETRLSELRSDIRTLQQWMAAGFIALLGGGLTGFLTLNSPLQQIALDQREMRGDIRVVDTKLGNVEVRMSGMDARLTNIEESLRRLEQTSSAPPRSADR